MTLLNSLLTIYSWGIVCILLFFLFSIARFYEKKSGRHAFFWAFGVPIVLFVLAAIRYLFLAPAIAGDIWGDALRFLGGITLAGFGYYLLRLMIGDRP
jgi:hypothetical protein